MMHQREAPANPIRTAVHSLLNPCGLLQPLMRRLTLLWCGKRYADLQRCLCWSLLAVERFFFLSFPHSDQ